MTSLNLSGITFGLLITLEMEGQVKYTAYYSFYKCKRLFRYSMHAVNINPVHSMHTAEMVVDTLVPMPHTA